MAAAQRPAREGPYCPPAPLTARRRSPPCPAPAAPLHAPCSRSPPRPVLCPGRRAGCGAGARGKGLRISAGMPAGILLLPGDGWAKWTKTPCAQFEALIHRVMQQCTGRGDSNTHNGCYNSQVTFLSLI